ncbi:MAG: 5-formyltetrahydrofolate cyclo-ligase [Crocinitomicaceae bacterium]|nr:5-formyltetrahydrofolate cyclo-ligase [Crocinitomicaceae bacterium]
MTKNEWRKHVLEKRDACPQELREQYAADVLQQVEQHPAFQAAITVFCFVSFRSEINTLPILELALKQQKAVAVPLVNRTEKVMEAIKITSLNQLQPGYMGILEPSPELEKLDPKTIDLCFVPGAAFDKAGHRIGYGGGFYDKFIPQLRQGCKTIGLGYAFQVIEAIPFEEHDHPLDEVITNLI